MRVDGADPAEEIRKIIKLFVRQVELRHLTPPLDAARLGLHPGVDEFARHRRVVRVATANPDIAQLRCEIGALAQYRMAINAAVLFPEALTPDHRFSKTS